MAFLVEDLEEQREGAIILEVDGEGAVRAVGSGDLAPSIGHEDILRGTTSTSAPVARLQHPAGCSHNSSGPLDGSSSAQNLGSQIHESGGIAANTMNSRELHPAWVRGSAGKTSTA